MLSDLDVYRAAHLMLHQYGDDAELEAARCADRMFGRGDREETLTWFRICRTGQRGIPACHRDLGCGKRAPRAPAQGRRLARAHQRRSQGGSGVYREADRAIENHLMRLGSDQNRL
jgi:hypothetical protein